VWQNLNQWREVLLGQKKLQPIGPIADADFCSILNIVSTESVLNIRQQLQTEHYEPETTT
jgi:hypothetical protein